MFAVPDLLSLKTLKFDKFEAAGREACGGREMGMSSLSCDGNVIEMTRQRLVHLEGVEGVPGRRARAACQGCVLTLKRTRDGRDPVDSVDVVDSPVASDQHTLTADDC